MQIIDGIKKNNFVVVGRVGMDLYPDPGVKTEETTGLTSNEELLACLRIGHYQRVTVIVSSECLQRGIGYGAGMHQDFFSSA